MLQPAIWVWITGENTDEVQHLGSINVQSEAKMPQTLENISQEMA